MISRNSLLIADRVFRELRRDVQTMVLFTISPTFVMILISGILHNYPQTFDRVGLIVVGLFPTAPAYLFTAFAIMRDRTRGTLEYLLTSPVKKLDVLAGYLLGFTVPAVVQVALTTGVSYGLLGLKSAGPCAGWSACSPWSTAPSAWRSGCSRSPSPATSISSRRS